MGKLYWFGVTIVLSLGLFTAWYVADQRQNEILLGPLHFESISQSLQPLLDPPTSNRKWFFIGLEPQNSMHLDVTQHLIANLEAEGPLLRVVDPYFENQLQIKVDLTLSLLQSRESFVEKIKILQQNMPEARVVIIVPNVLVSQIVSESLFYSESVQSQLPSYQILTLTSFPVSKEEESEFFLPCSESQQVRTGLSELGCYILQLVRPRYVQLSSLKKPSGFVVRFNDRELVLFLR
jgi:hypothetical protein